MNKKLIIIIAAVVLLGGGAAAFFLMSGKKDAPAAKEAKKEEKKEEAAKEEKKADEGEHKETAKAEEGKGEAKKAEEPSVNKDELPNKEEAMVPEEYSYKMDPLVANIFDKNSIHYLKLGVMLVASNAEAIEELKAKKPQLSDKLLFILSDISMREVLSAGGKALVKEDIQDAFNKMLTKGKVTKVYFTDFTVQ